MRLQMERVLATADSWQFDAFKLTEVTQGHPLSTLGYYLFHTAGLIERFGLPHVKVARFFRRVEEGYSSNP